MGPDRVAHIFVFYNTMISRRQKEKPSVCNSFNDLPTYVSFKEQKHRSEELQFLLWFDVKRFSGFLYNLFKLSMDVNRQRTRAQQRQKCYHTLPVVC